LSWAHDLTAGLDDAEHGILNSEGVNVLRSISSRGLRIMGARTVSSEPNARYVNVRRLVMMVVEAVDLATQWAVFEPNNGLTRAKVRIAMTSFVTALWQRGALMGDRAEAAFFVRCDETNNPPESRDLGRLVADVGIAPSVPFEFVVVRVGRIDDTLEIAETVAKGAAA
jgi:phage tail sheath protein FI